MHERRHLLTRRCDIMLRAAANVHKERTAAAEKARPKGADMGLGAGIGDIDEDEDDYGGRGRMGALSWRDENFTIHEGS